MRNSDKQLRRAVTIVIGFVISALFLWIAGRNTDLSAVGASFRSVKYWEMIPLATGMIIFYWVRTYRWKVLLAPISDVKTSEIFGPVMIGYGANFLLPLQLGEIARTLAARDRTGLTFMPIAFSIIVERLFDFLVILFALSLALAFHESLPKYLSDLGVAVGTIVLVLLFLTVVFVLRTEAVLRLVNRLIIFLPKNVQELVLRQLRIGSEGLQSVRHRRTLLLATVTSLAQWSIIVFCIGVSLHAFELQVPLETLLLIVALIVLGGTLPNAPGYIGSIQAGFVVALELTNGDPAKGIAASLFYHSVYAATAISLGLFSLRHSGLNWKSITEIGREQVD